MRRALRVAGVLVVVVAAACSGGPELPVAETTTTAPLVLADGTHFGFVTALEPAELRLVFDPAELVDGEVGNADHETFRLPMSPDLVVRLLKPCCDLSEHTFADWYAGFEPDARTFYGTASSRYEVTIDDGVVTRVEEFYLP